MELQISEKGEGMMKVYQSISAVSSALSKEGIAKNRNNEQQRYKFRGIDDVMNALAPLLSANNLVILPEVLERDCVERQTKTGGALFYVTVKTKYTLVNTEDESRHDVIVYGEAMDSADKATNKAMSAAYKYMTIQAFCIPTEGDNDADAHTHEVAARAAAMQQNKRVAQAAINDLRTVSAGPGASPEVPPTADQGEGAGQLAPSVPSDDPTTKYRRILAITKMTAKDINAWWQTVPVELRQDLTEDFREALKAAAKG